MSGLFKFIFEGIVGSFTVSDNILHNYLIMGFIGMISFPISFGFVRHLYRDGFISGKLLGQISFWLTYTLVTLVLMMLSAFVFFLVKLVLSVHFLIWIIVVLLAIFAILRFKIYTNFDE
jgi:hypothetical protein